MMSFCTSYFKLIVTFSIVFLFAIRVGWSQELYTQRGSDPTWAEIMEDPPFPIGQNSTQGYKGSEIDVNNEVVEDCTYGVYSIDQNINIHTLCNSFISRTYFDRWTRWYQEDGNTQVFRAFEGEHNVRNDRPGAGRIEAFSSVKWHEDDGEWHEWVGTYTIVKPHGCAIFQAKNNINDWGIMINMTDNGDIILNHRRHKEDVVIAHNMTGKSFDLRIRDNGRDYEVYYNGQLAGYGHYDRPEGTTGFRWGMYNGTFKHDAMIFVTGATVDPVVSVPGDILIDVDESKGTVTKSPDKLNYDDGEEVVLTAEAQPGFMFKNWTGDYEGDENPLTLTVDSRIQITANFVPAYTVTISENTTNGSVEISPEKELYEVGETVTFTPKPAQNYEFHSWYAEGGIGGNDIPLVFTMNRDIELTAYFSLKTYELNTWANNGTITRSPHSMIYAVGTEIELTATPDAGYQFSGWSGDVSGEENPLTITMDSTISVIANFDQSTGMDLESAPLLQVYPNPSHGVFNVKIDQKTTYSIYNIYGIQIKEGKVSGNFELDMNGYNEKIYVLEIKTEDGVAVKRLLIK